MDYKFPATLQNTFRVKKYKRGASQPYEIMEKHNTIQAAGKDLFLNLITNNSTDHLNANTDLVLDATGSPTTLGTCDANFPKDSTDVAVSANNVVYQWTDSTTNTYATGTVRVRSPAGVIFSSSTPGWGTKPSNEEWVYEYTLSISSADPDISGQSGIDRLLRMVAATTVEHMDTLNTDCYISVGATTVNCSSGPTVNTSTDTISWQFAFGPGIATGTWTTGDTLRIINANGGVDLRNGTSGISGTKGASDTWTITYQFSI